jgi:hypothetical protein
MLVTANQDIKCRLVTLLNPLDQQLISALLADSGEPLGLPASPLTNEIDPTCRLKFWNL